MHPFPNTLVVSHESNTMVQQQTSKKAEIYVQKLKRMDEYEATTRTPTSKHFLAGKCTG